MTHKIVWFALLAAIGCNGADEKVGRERHQEGKSRPGGSSVSRSEPPWLFPTTSFSPGIDEPSEEDGVQIQIAADGYLTLGVPENQVRTTLDEIDLRLTKTKKGDEVDTDGVVVRPTVEIEVAANTLWDRVSSIMRLCEIRHHRRVSLHMDSRRIDFTVPANVARDYPPIPDGARVPIVLSRDRTGMAIVRFRGRRSDLESFRKRIGGIAWNGSPTVAVLEVAADVQCDDVVTLFGILNEADIRRALLFW